MIQPKPGDFTKVLTIKRIEQLNNSFYGNPRYHVTFTNGLGAKTQSDATVNYGINNPEYKNVPLLVLFSKDGTIKYLDIYVDLEKLNEKN